MSPDERIAKNESLFREANERIKEMSDSFADVDPSPVQFVCECGRTGCTEPITLTLREYEDIRTDSRHFAVVPGHVDSLRERVIDDRGGYSVVEKIGEAAEVAIDLDPRP
jgi:diaminopimelate decarboxylase